MIHRRECWPRRFLNLVQIRECQGVPVRRVCNDPPSGPRRDSPRTGVVEVGNEMGSLGELTMQYDAEHRKEVGSEFVETT